MNYSVKCLILLSLINLFSCDRSKDEPVEEFMMEATALTTTINGFSKKDEVLEFEFTLINDYHDFSFAQVFWEYNQGDEVVKQQVSTISVSDFAQVDNKIIFQYSITEESLYNTLRPNLDEVDESSKFQLSWYAYDKNQDLLDSNEGEEIVIAIECEIDDQFMTGQYMLTSSARDLLWGSRPIIEQDTVNIVVGSNRLERQFDVGIYTSLNVTLRMVLGCHGISVPEELNSDELVCTDGPHVFNSETANELDFIDDSALSFSFILDYYNNCGLIQEETLTLVKI